MIFGDEAATPVFYSNVFQNLKQILKIWLIIYIIINLIKRIVMVTVKLVTIDHSQGVLRMAITLSISPGVKTLMISHQQVAGCIGKYYGYEPGVHVFYQNAAILVGISKWGECRKSCGLGSPQETQEKERLESGSKEILDKFCFHGEMLNEDEHRSLIVEGSDEDY